MLHCPAPRRRSVLASLRRVTGRVLGGVLAIVLLAMPSTRARASTAAAQDSGPVAIYVGPAQRDGFVDVDRGVLDSIADVKRELARDRRRFRVIETRDTATVQVTITARESKDQTIATSGAGVAVLTSTDGLVLRGTLAVGDYKKELVGTDALMWRGAAQIMVRDIVVWVDANRDRLAGIKQQ